MRWIMTTVIVTALAASSSAFAQSPPATIDVPVFATAAEVQALIEKAKASIKPGQTMLGQPVVRLAPYAATLEYRPIPAPPSVHASNAEFIYIVSGAGTMTTGGSMNDPKAGAGGNSTGSGITGGTARKLAPGDMLMVPEGTPHQFSGIDSTLIALTIKFPRPVNSVAR